MNKESKCLSVQMLSVNQTTLLVGGAMDIMGSSMTNVGVVVYTRGKSQGTFDTKWSHSTNGSGTGRLTGGPVKGIAGTYKALYFDEQGKEKFSLDLIVQNEGDHYTLTWTMDGETICIGMGNEVSGALVAGYSFVDVKWLNRP